MKVISTTSIRNRMFTLKKNKFSLKVKSLKKTSPKLAKSKTIKMLMALLATKTFAKSLLGLEINLVNFFAFPVSKLSNWSNSDFVREKNATSDPEINAEHINKPNVKRQLIMVSNGIPVSCMGSGNVLWFFKMVNRQ